MLEHAGVEPARFYPFSIPSIGSFVRSASIFSCSYFPKVSYLIERGHLHILPLIRIGA